MLLMKVAILCPSVTLIFLSSGLLLELHISVILVNLFFIALIKVFIAQYLSFCIANKIDPLIFVFI